MSMESGMRDLMQIWMQCACLGCVVDDEDIGKCP